MIILKFLYNFIKGFYIFCKMFLHLLYCFYYVIVYSLYVLLPFLSKILFNYIPITVFYLKL